MERHLRHYFGVLTRAGSEIGQTLDSGTGVTKIVVEVNGNGRRLTNVSGGF